MTRKKMIISVLCSVAIVAWSGTAFAQQASTSPTLEDLQKQVQQLLAAMQGLQQQVVSLKKELGVQQVAPAPATPQVPVDSVESNAAGDVIQEETAVTAPEITRTLVRGSRGEDVRRLQEFLAQDPSASAEGLLLTGYFGPGTEAALKRWQAKNGLESVGIVGRRTVAKFREINQGVLKRISRQQEQPADTQDQTNSVKDQTKQSPVPTPPSEEIKHTLDKKEICPTLPTVDSCPAGQERVAMYSSSSCGAYYSCRATSQTTLQTAAQTANGTSSPQNYSSGCDSALTALLGTGCHQMYSDSSGSQIFCDGPMTKSAKRGDAAATAGCSGSGYPSGTTSGYVPPAGQKEQIWNSLGLRSWIRADADTTRIESLKQSCSTVSSGANIWMSGAGDSSSSDFGMPSAEKCRLAAACTSTQYFNGTSCVSTGSGNTGDTGSTTSCSQYGSGWHTMNSDGNCYDSEMRNYRVTNGTLYSCSITPASGCTSTPSGSSCVSGQYWNGSACVSSTTGTSCPSGQYWNGSACVNSTSGTTCASDQYWNGASCVANTTTSCSQYGSGWHTMNSDGNCYDSEMRNYHTANGTLYACSSAPASGCSSSSSSSCTSGQYWNGSACVISTSGTSCTSGQYWNGSACVANSTPTPTPTPTTTTTCTSGQYWNGTSCVSSASSCSSGQYWNGSACVANPTPTPTPTTTTTCPTGQYWSGSACVANSTSGASTISAVDLGRIQTLLQSISNSLRGLIR